MAMTQQIQESVQRLPTVFHPEVLDFIEYLLAKSEREALRQEEHAWSSVSLASALRDLDDEPTLYTVSDLKVAF